MEEQCEGRGGERGQERGREGKQAPHTHRLWASEPF